MAARRRDDDPIDPMALLAGVMNWLQQLPVAVLLALLAVVVVAGLVLAAIWFEQQQQRQTPSRGPVAGGGTSPQLWLGNPSGAGTDPSNYLMVKPYFAESYNDTTGTPNWVSWRLTAADVGTTPRDNRFVPDDTLPAAFFHVTSFDYDRSGFDRGHQCPAGDRSADRQSSDATFVMTNMCPQAPNVNRKAWEHCESYCRSLARAHHRLYVIDGPAGRGGVGSLGRRDALAGGRVVVPAVCWKVAVILDDDPGYDPDPASLPASTRVLTVVMPNDQTQVGDDWDQWRTSPAEVERRTGLHLFDRFRPDVAEALRARVDRMALPRPETRRREE